MQQLKQSSYGVRHSEGKPSGPKQAGLVPKGFKKSKSSQHSSPYLSTEVTTLDMNAFFTQNQQMKKMNSGFKSAASRQHQQQHLNEAAQYLSQQQNYGLQNYSIPSMYPGFDQNFQDFMSPDLPSLMNIAPYKQNSTGAFDMSQLSSELLNVNSGAGRLGRLTGAGDLHCSKNSFEDPSKMPIQNSRQLSFTNSSRSNRMVELKTIDDGNSCCSVLVASDPLSNSTVNRPTVVKLNNSRQQVNQRNMEPRISPEALYSRKVFIGGLPIDVSEHEVWATFGAFGKVLVDWPRRPEHGRGDYYELDLQGRRNSRSVSGYVFLVFQNEQSVQDLVNSCEIYDNKYYLELSSPTMCDKAVQVRAWRLSDIDYFADDSASIDHRRTVFIGGVPRPTRANDLARCLEALYGKVSYVGIDIDPELKYPKGAARVTFSTAKSFVAAISGRFVQVNHSDTNKRVEIKPYVMEDQICDECEGKMCKYNYAPYFCGDPSCLQYYCETCWDRLHYVMSPSRGEHRPMVRTGDQTRVLPRPPHHPHNNSYHHRHGVSGVAQNEPQQSVISRITSRKGFSATPTPIGF